MVDEHLCKPTCLSKWLHHSPMEIGKKYLPHVSFRNHHLWANLFLNVYIQLKSVTINENLFTHHHPKKSKTKKKTHLACCALVSSAVRSSRHCAASADKAWALCSAAAAAFGWWVGFSSRLLSPGGQRFSYQQLSAMHTRYFVLCDQHTRPGLIKPEVSSISAWFFKYEGMIRSCLVQGCES